MIRLGEHYLAELAGCNSRVLSDTSSIEHILLESCEKANAHRREHQFYNLKDGSVSGVIIIEESHISIHTFPDKEYAIADFFTCSPDVNEEAGIAHLAEQLKSVKHGYSKLDRGLMLPYHTVNIAKEIEATEAGNNCTYESCGIEIEHLLLDAWDCNPETISRQCFMEIPFLRAAQSGGQDVLYRKFHNFSPHGTSGFILGEKSHVTVHSWPEHRYCAIDIMGQKGKTDKEKIRDELLRFLQPKNVFEAKKSYTESTLERGSLDSIGTNTIINSY